MAGKLDILINQLNASPTAKGDQALWQVIIQLIRKLKEIEALANNGGGSGSSINNITNIHQFLSDGDSGGGGDTEIIMINQGGSSEPTHYDAPLTDGDVDETDLIFAAGECIIVQVPI